MRLLPFIRWQRSSMFLNDLLLEDWNPAVLFCFLGENFVLLEKAMNFSMPIFPWGQRFQRHGGILEGRANYFTSFNKIPNESLNIHAYIYIHTRTRAFDHVQCTADTCCVLCSFEVLYVYLHHKSATKCWEIPMHLWYLKCLCSCSSYTVPTNTSHKPHDPMVIAASSRLIILIHAKWGRATCYWF